jgi:hypothetical protein
VTTVRGTIVQVVAVPGSADARFFETGIRNRTLVLVVARQRVEYVDTARLGSAEVVGTQVEIVAIPGGSLAQPLLTMVILGAEVDIVARSQIRSIHGLTHTGPGVAQIGPTDGILWTVDDSGGIDDAVPVDAVVSSVAQVVVVLGFAVLVIGTLAHPFPRYTASVQTGISHGAGIAVGTGACAVLKHTARHRIAGIHRTLIEIITNPLLGKPADSIDTDIPHRAHFSVITFLSHGQRTAINGTRFGHRSVAPFPGRNTGPLQALIRRPAVPSVSTVVVLYAVYAAPGTCVAVKVELLAFRLCAGGRFILTSIVDALQSTLAVTVDETLDTGLDLGLTVSGSTFLMGGTGGRLRTDFVGLRHGIRCIRSVQHFPMVCLLPLRRPLRTDVSQDLTVASAIRRRRAGRTNHRNQHRQTPHSPLKVHVVSPPPTPAVPARSETRSTAGLSLTGQESENNRFVRIRRDASVEGRRGT